MKVAKLLPNLYYAREYITVTHTLQCSSTVVFLVTKYLRHCRCPLKLLENTQLYKHRILHINATSAITFNYVQYLLIYSLKNIIYDKLYFVIDIIF